MIRHRNTRIIATLGPASSDEATIRSMFAAGADAFRINMSHIDHSQLGGTIDMIRQIEREARQPIAILVDIQGPKLRVGVIGEEHGVEVEEGAYYQFDTNEAPGDATRVFLPHPEIFNAVAVGDSILLNDGALRFRVTDCKSEVITMKIEIGGILSSRKGVSLADTVLPVGSLTPKDKEDLKAAVAHNADWIAISFVQRPEDVLEARSLAGTDVNIMSKIEKPQALAHINDILELSDAVMVARGDLGVELPIENVPGVQKMITREARRIGKPCVIATQMLESMITSNVPTRAEVSDVANAVFDQADAVMLSAESAVGKYPIESVAAMDKIIKQVESDDSYLRSKTRGERRRTHRGNVASALCMAADNIAANIEAQAIVCYSATGSSVQKMSRERPVTQILALSPSISVIRKLAIVWGVHAVMGDEPENQVDMIEFAVIAAKDAKLVRPGQQVVIIAGIPFGKINSTNMLRIADIDM